jgi:hypothetical protein
MPVVRLTAAVEADADADPVTREQRKKSLVQ